MSLPAVKKMESPAAEARPPGGGRARETLRRRDLGRGHFGFDLIEIAGGLVAVQPGVGGGAPGGGGFQDFGDLGGFTDIFDDLFGDLFGGRRAGARRRGRLGAAGVG